MGALVLIIGCQPENPPVERPDEDASRSGDVSVGPDGGSDGGGGMTSRRKAAGGHYCASGARLEGDGIRAVVCTGPSETAGPTAKGDGIVWQPGAHRVFAP
jgi:hypothetical protein